MAMIELGNARVSIGGVDLTPYLRDVGLEPWQEQFLQRIDNLPSGTLQLTGFWVTSRGHASAEQYEAIRSLFDYWECVKRWRLRRMHTAYGRRCGRGRW